MATVKTSVKRLLDTYTYYAALNEIRLNAKAENKPEGKALADALFAMLAPAERLDDDMEPEGSGEDDDEGDDGEDEKDDDSE